MILWLDSDADESVKKHFYDTQHTRYVQLLIEQQQLADEYSRHTVCYGGNTN